MKNNSNSRNHLYNKIKNLNSSINKMVDCVKHLEKLRSYSYLTCIDDEELEKVLNHMQEIEDSIEKLNCGNEKPEYQKGVFKAIGKNKKLWVSRPEDSTHKTGCGQLDRSGKQTFKTNPQEGRNRTAYYPDEEITGQENRQKPNYLSIKDKN